MPKHRTQQERDKAVEAYLAKEATVEELVKRHQVSRPAMYQWINAYKSRHPEAGAGKAKANADETLPQRVARLEAENARLRKKLFDLMVKTGEL